jgi:hypothetical protein
MLAISLLVLGTAMLFALLDKSTYPETSPPKVQLAPRAAPNVPPSAPQIQPGQAPGVQQGAQPPIVAPGAQQGGQAPPKQ